MFFYIRFDLLPTIVLGVMMAISICLVVQMSLNLLWKSFKVILAIVCMVVVVGGAFLTVQRNDLLSVALKTFMLK